MIVSSIRFGRGRVARTLAAVVVAGCVGGLASIAPTGVARADTTESATTVKWRGGNPTDIQKYQPDHAALTSDGAGNDAGSGHWDDFKDLEVTVSKTRGLRDEVVTVSASGMAATDGATFRASNFLQVFQCWGPDPLAPDFNETCQFGAWSNDAGSRASGQLPVVPTGFGRGGPIDFPQDLDPTVRFRSVSGEYATPFNAETQIVDGTSRYYTDSTSNELPFVAIQSGRRGDAAFETQSAASAPHLGCGSPTSAAGSRCWLVVVPRGTHSGDPAGGLGNRCEGLGAPFGAVTSSQSGSPLERRDCTFWADRVVVPLDFDNPFQACDAGVSERRVSGSELVAEALSSWQSALCTGANATAFSLTTNSGPLTRSQLLTGQIPFALVSRALAPDTIGAADPELLRDAQLAYAPLLNTGLSIAYVSERESGRIQHRDLKLTPRLVVKLLTQSYSAQIPRVELVGDSPPHAASRPLNPARDPEWAAIGNAIDDLNDGLTGYFVVSGPAGDDAIRLLWEYVQADADAAAFLRGEPDPWGLVVNPYYLPSGHSNALGGGLPDDLSRVPADTFLTADQTLAPSKVLADRDTGGKQIDSIAMTPYSASLEANAVRIFRADTKRTSQWDSTKANSAGEMGAYVAKAPQGPMSGRFILGPTTSAAAERYSLPTMAMAIPAAQRTSKDTVGSSRHFVAPTTESIGSAAAALKTDAATGVAAPDFRALPTNGYPLTTTVYGTVDLASRRLDQPARVDYSKLLRYAADEGQIPGSNRGQLPDGYAPLTVSQRQATLAVADKLLEPIPDEEGGADPEDSPPLSNANSGSVAAAAAANQGTAQTATAPLGTVDAASTKAMQAPTQAVLGGALLAGVVGLVASPFLLRRRGSP